MVFIMDTDCGLGEVQTEFIYIMLMEVSLQTIRQLIKIIFIALYDLYEKKSCNTHVILLVNLDITFVLCRVQVCAFKSFL